MYYSPHTHSLSFSPSGFTSVVLSTIEKRYNLSSTAAGMIAVTFDISVVFSVLFISYFGGRSHKPRWLGVGLIIQGIGAFIFATPQFYSPYQAGSSDNTQLQVVSTRETKPSGLFRREKRNRLGLTELWLCLRFVSLR